MNVSSVLVDGESEYVVEHGTSAWYAALEWVRFHGLDPMRIPAGSAIVRDAGGCRILFEEFVKCGPEVEDIVIADNEPVTVARVEQGEAPPLPFPREVTG